MLQNYLKVAWRNIKKNKVHSLINMMGLALGMTGAILLLLNIQYGMSIDQFHEKKANIYEAYNKGIVSGQLTCWNSTAPPLGPALKKNFPEIRHVARVLYTDRLLRYADKKIQAQGSFTDPDFLTMFSFPLVLGNSATVLRDANAIVITQKLAEKMFGSENPINKTISTPTGDNFTVSGVLKDLPDNTQFKFEYLLPWQYLEANGRSAGSWTNQNSSTFVELMPDARISAVNQKIAGVAANSSSLLAGQQIFLYPLTKVYLENKFVNGQPSGGKIESLRMLAALAGIILLIACINFMNLSTARSEKRAKEVGVRKVVGASRQSLLLQFIGESVLMALLAGIAAFLLAEMALPAFSSLIRAQLYMPWTSPAFWGMALGFILLTGLLAGSYPAFYLSSFRPVKVLKGVMQSVNKLVTPRKILVVLQFVFSIFLINFTVIIQKQIRYELNRETGFVKENLVYQSLTPDLRKNYTAIKNELINTGTALAVSRSNTIITNITAEESGLKWSGMDPKANAAFVLIQEGGDFIRTNGLTLKGGRDIDLTDYPGDTLSCVVNETSAKILGFKQPVGQIIVDEEERWKIVGVVKDFLIGDPNDASKPVLIKGGTGNDYMTIRLNTDKPSFQTVLQSETILKKYNPNFLTDIRFVDEDYAEKFRQARNIGSLINIFAFMAIFISCIGLLGLSTYMAENRTKEIGIRKVLGASVRGITTLLARNFIQLILISIIVASPLSWLFMNVFLHQFSYRTTLSAWVPLGAGAAALAIALFTISFQVIRAAQMNPVTNLRTE